MTIAELLPQYDTAKSFYNKATLHFDNDEIKLISYTTHVATFNIYSKEIKIFGLYSNTTLRHIKEFIYQMTEGTPQRPVLKLTQKIIEAQYTCNKQLSTYHTQRRS